MTRMFLVRALAPNLQPSPSLHAACTTTTPTALSPPGPYLALFRMPSLASRQGAREFNQPLSFNVSSVTDMVQMFYVRSSRALQPAAATAACACASCACACAEATAAAACACASSSCPISSWTPP